MRDKVENRIGDMGNRNLGRRYYQLNWEINKGGIKLGTKIRTTIILSNNEKIIRLGDKISKKRILFKKDYIYIYKI